MTLRIVLWDKHFENSRSRAIENTNWVPFPNKQDGDGYTELLDHQDGAAHFGAWCAIAQVASKCRPRGTLVRDGGQDHTPVTLSRMTRIPAALLEAAIRRLISPIGWLEDVSQVVSETGLVEERHSNGSPLPPTAVALPSSAVGLSQNGMEQNGMEQKEEPHKKDGQQELETSKKKHVFAPNHMKWAEWMWREVQLVNPAAKPPNLNAWANQVRLMEAKDKRELNDAWDLFELASAHHFWQTNILSPEKFREKFDTLHLQLRTSPAAKGSKWQDLTPQPTT